MSSEFVSLEDKVVFTISTHNVSGIRVNADATPRWYVFERLSHDYLLTDLFIARSGNANEFTGHYYGHFDASGVSGFEANKFYEVLASGKVDNAVGFETVKTFVVNDIYDTNVIKISGDLTSAYNAKGFFDGNLTGYAGYDGYQDGVWVDTQNGVAGTLIGTHGTHLNPASTWANAVTIANSLGIKRFHVKPASTITLNGDSQNYEIVGTKGSWILDFDNQNVNSAFIEGAVITGDGVGGSGETTFDGCIFSTSVNCVLGGNSIIKNSILTTGIHAVSGVSGKYTFINCKSDEQSNVPDFDFSTSTNHSTWLKVYNYDGRLRLRNFNQSGNDSAKITGNGTLILENTCISGTVDLFGVWSITNQGTSKISYETHPGDIIEWSGVPVAPNTVAGYPRVDIHYISGHPLAPSTITDFHAPPSGIADAVWNEPRSEHTTAGTFGEYVNTQDLYYADIHYVKDGINNVDEYNVAWFKNSVIINSGDITNPAISSYSSVNGTPYFENQTLNYADSDLGILRFNKSTPLIPSGEPFLVVTSGTIDSSARTWQKVIGISVF